MLEQRGAAKSKKWVKVGEGRMPVRLHSVQGRRRRCELKGVVVVGCVFVGRVKHISASALSVVKPERGPEEVQLPKKHRQ